MWIFQAFQYVLGVTGFDAFMNTVAWFNREWSKGLYNDIELLMNPKMFEGNDKVTVIIDIVAVVSI